MLFFRFLAMFVLVFPSAYAAYVKSPYVKTSVWNRTAPYFVPEELAVKGVLDDIFKRARATLSVDSMKRAGFDVVPPQEHTRIVIARHPRLEGYLIKTCLDCQRARGNKPEEYFWILRITGARKIEELIVEKGWEDVFKVPKKWLYPIPADPSPPGTFRRVNFLLIEEDMDLLGGEANKVCWKSDEVGVGLLDKVYYILETLGLDDCGKPDNIPFAKDGRIAFIDTQSHGEWPVRFERLTRYLSRDNQVYWKSLIKKRK